MTPDRSSHTLRCVSCASSTALRTGTSSPRRPLNVRMRSRSSHLSRVKVKPSSVVRRVHDDDEVGRLQGVDEGCRARASGEGSPRGASRCDSRRGRARRDGRLLFPPPRSHVRGREWSGRARVGRAVPVSRTNCAVSTLCGMSSSVTRKFEASRSATASSLRPVTETSTRDQVDPRSKGGLRGLVPARVAVRRASRVRTRPAQRLDERPEASHKYGAQGSLAPRRAAGGAVRLKSGQAGKPGC